MTDTEHPRQPTAKDRELAWILHTEFRTRIATQGLHYRAGDEGAALESLHQLFGIARQAIKAGGPECRQVANLVIDALNVQLRPFTARWHRRQVEGRLVNDDDRRVFRRELEGVRQRLSEFSRELEHIAEGGNSREAVEALPVTPPPNDTPLPFDRLLFAWSPANADSLLEAEQEAILKRRAAAKMAAGGDEAAAAPLTNLAGLACSGGGIRSATLCLGVAQSLAKHGILPRLDYVSTVSGGGYFGAFLSSYLNDKYHEKVGLEPGKLPFAEAGQPEPAPLRQLRNQSKYLLKGGFLGQSRMVGLLLFGMLVNLLTLLPVLAGGLAITQALRLGGLDGAEFEAFVNFTLAGLGAVLVLLLIGLPLIYRKLAARRSAIARYERAAIGVALAWLAVWALGDRLPAVYAQLQHLFGPAKVAGLFALLPIVLAGAAFAVGLNQPAGRVLLALTGASGPLLLLMGYFALNESWPPDLWSLLLCFGLAAGLVWWLRGINVNQISSHRYYRNRLAETYLLRRGDAAAVDPQPLSQLRARNPAAPYHLINAAVNLPSSQQPELRGRNADFFLFSQHYCGSPLLGYCTTPALEAADGHLDLGTAMAISGAAASGHMGATTLKGLEFMLSLLNIRLGYWLPNPGKLPAGGNGFGVPPFALWRELFGRMDETGPHVNLSDGGHIENLGVYELLRRRCKYVIAIDAEADPDLRFAGLMTLIRYAQIDFGIRISLDLDDLHRTPSGYSKAHFALGVIDYGQGLRGYLLYIKSSLTGNERDYLLDYHRRHSSFPHETTADQFFNEAQFEAYRALGEHIGDDLFREEFAPAGSPVSLESWFHALAANMLEMG